MSMYFAKHPLMKCLRRPVERCAFLSPVQQMDGRPTEFEPVRLSTTSDFCPSVRPKAGTNGLTNTLEKANILRLRFDDSIQFSAHWSIDFPAMEYHLSTCVRYCSRARPVLLG